MPRLLLVLVVTICPWGLLVSQDSLLKKDTTDALSILRKILNKKERENPPRFAIIPAVGFNPSFGLTLGVNGTGVFHAGRNPTNRLSSVFFNPFWSTKNSINFQLRQNLFFKNNDFFLIGNTQIAKLIIQTYRVNEYEEEFPVESNNYRFNQRIYRRIAGHFYAGTGLAFEIYNQIGDEKLDLTNSKTTPHYNYSTAKGFNTERYNLNGISAGLLYHTQEHPQRAYGGWFAEVLVRFNQTWLGSSKNSTALYSDIRKYFSLSAKNPEHVLAFWQLSGFSLGGVMPFLALPATGLDLYNRSGRAYAIGRFRGNNYFYIESEYRFPITRNKLFSGVTFINMQTVSAENTYELFDRISPSAGVGLRVLISKRTRSNVCLDYALGFDGKSGVFFGLNEVF